MLSSGTLIIALSLSSVWASFPKSVPKNDFGARVINGEEAQEGQFPWQVAIWLQTEVLPLYLCGGALISDEWVLTAGHCVADAISGTVYSGTTKLSNPDGISTEAAEFILHEDYMLYFLNNDVGLIRLAKPLELNDNTQPIPLAEEELGEGVAVTISGWGTTSDSAQNYTESLKYISVPTISNDECETIYGTPTVYPGMVCTGTGEPLQSPCVGDSGGPVVLNIDSDPVHVAISSFINAYGCERVFPSGHSRTAYHRDWIRNKTGI